MAVEVRVPGADAPNVHDGATSMQVTEGNLVVSRWNGATYETVAIYASGHWSSAEIVYRAV